MQPFNDMNPSSLRLATLFLTLLITCFPAVIPGTPLLHTKLKCMTPTDARYIRPAISIPNTWLNQGWHTGAYLSKEGTQQVTSQQSQPVTLSSVGIPIWWLQGEDMSVYLISADETLLVCAHTVSGVQVGWFPNTMKNRDEDWCKWIVEIHADDQPETFRLKNRIFIDTMPEVRYLYFDQTGIYFDYKQSSRNYPENQVNSSQTWWRWEKVSATQREFGGIENDCDSATSDFSSNRTDGLEVQARSLISSRVRTRTSPRYFVSEDKFTTCGPSWFLFDGKCYRLFRNIIKTQEKAQRICKYFGAALVLPRNQRQQSFLARFSKAFDRRGAFWLGMSSTESSNRFNDLAGNRVTFRRWSRSRGAFLSDNCAIWRRRWYTANCVSKHKVLCEREASQRVDLKCGKIADGGIDEVMKREAGFGNGHNRIVDGTPADPGQFPWQASIRFKKPVDVDGELVYHNCGGTLIDKCWVLSAAHCFSGRNFTGRFNVRLGDLNNVVDDGTEQTFDIERVIIHEQYQLTPSPRSDIALIKLQKRRGKCADFNADVVPACLPDESFPVSAGSLCQVSGWGNTNTSFGTSSASKNLMYATLPVLPTNYCESRYNKNGAQFFLNDVMMCAGLKKGGRDACTGDSGGPYVCRNKQGRYGLIGIVSFGIGCARRNYPGVYTNVRHFVPWISSKIEASGGRSDIGRR